MGIHKKSLEILEKNKQYIPGGVVSVNRATNPELVFVKGAGACIWDADGARYLDYHAAFAAHFLGHDDPYVTEAVKKVLSEGASLFGTGATILEGKLAELICSHIPFVDSVQFLNSGSEATYQAIRASRAITGRDHVIVMQGGYNGWHNDVACNLMTPLSELGPRVSPGEYPFAAISAGIPEEHRTLVHPINFNDPDSVEDVCRRYRVASLITEPILQNIGVVPPRPGYLERLRELADQYGFLLIFDEVKTGFRHGLQGYAGIAGVKPDFVIYGKAIANGYPIAVIGGRRDYMESFVHPDLSKRALLAGTYNAHPVPTAAAIATIERLASDDGALYRHVEALGQQIETGIHDIAVRTDIEVTVARQGSAFCVYFMDHVPVDWHDLAAHHNFEFDTRLRLELIERGVYFFPLATKQASISCAHALAEITFTLDVFEASLAACLSAAAVS